MFVLNFKTMAKYKTEDLLIVIEQLISRVEKLEKDLKHTHWYTNEVCRSHNELDEKVNLLKKSIPLDENCRYNGTIHSITKFGSEKSWRGTPMQNHEITFDGRENVVYYAFYRKDKFNVGDRVSFSINEGRVEELRLM